MPNWCDNQTEIVFKSEVKQEEIKEFIDKLIIKNEDGDKVINLKKLVPLQENGEWDYDLAVEKWGSKWSPFVDSIEYNETDKTLKFDYQSAWNPINEAFETIFENHSNLIEKISTNFEEPGMSFYGDFYVDKNGSHAVAYDLPSINIEEDEFKKLYDLIKYKNIDVELPEQMMEDINNSKSYDDFLKNISFDDDFDIDEYDFEELWDNYIYDNEIHFDLREQMKEQSQDFSDYVNDIVKEFALKKRK